MVRYVSQILYYDLATSQFESRLLLYIFDCIIYNMFITLVSLQMHSNCLISSYNMFTAHVYRNM